MIDNLGALQNISYIWYLVQFKRNYNIKALLDSRSKINAMTLAYATELGLRPRATNVNIQEIDGSALEIYVMISASFSLQDRQKRV